MASANPGQIAVNSTVPFGAQGLDQATWTAGAAWKLLNGIIQQAIKFGDASQVGLPASWPYGPIQNEDILSGGKASPILEAKVQNYVNSQQAQADPDFNSFVGANYATAAPGGYIDKPLSVSEQLAKEKWEFDKAQSLLKMATGGGSGGGTVPRASTTRVSTSVGSSQSGGIADDLALLDARTNASRSLEQQQFDLQKELMLLQFQLDNDPNNPKLLLQQQQLAEEVRQFNASLALQEKAQGMDRAKIISDYGANPGDAVAREYFLHQGANPVGNAVDIFTGQPIGQQMTLSQVMQNNAPIVNPSMNLPQGAPPPPEAPPPTPTEEPPPQFAHGTDPQLTRDGWTKANKFITGDHPMGMPNPEVNQVRVRNGQAETKVTPLSQLMRAPKFADGTDPWAWQGMDYNQADGDSSAGLDFGTPYNPQNLAQPQSGAYQTSKYRSPSYTPTGQSTLVTGDVKDPYAVQKNSGVAYNTSQIAADPYFGTQYQGMKASDVISNGNSAFYGQTVGDAFQSDIRNKLATDPKGFDALGQTLNNEYNPMTVVGPMGGMTTDGWLGSGADSAAIAGEFGHEDPAYYSFYGNTGYQRPVNNVNTQAEAGILTGAQMGKGVTQSANPGAPGYVRPQGSIPLPGEGKAQGPTDEPGVGNLANDQIENGKPVVDQPTQMTAPTTVPMQKPDASGNSLVTGVGQFIKDGATYDLKPGDYQKPDGSWVRYDPVFKEYMPIQPQLTQISNEKDFWKLPTDVQQKILTGQPTGYALVGPWRDGLLAGLTQAEAPMKQDAFNALSDDEKRNMITNPPTIQGSYLPSQTAPGFDNGSMKGGLSGLLRLLQPEGTMTGGQFDYSNYVGQWKSPDGTTRLRNQPLDALMNPGGAMNPNQVAQWQQNTGLRPPASTNTDTQPGPRPPSTPTPTTPPTGTPPTGTPPAGTPPPAPVNPPPAGTPPAGNAPNPLSELLKLLGLSYDGTTWQNNPALSYLSGNTSEGDYGNITNNPVEVPGLGVTLPSPNQAMNYSMLQNLINSGGFDLLNAMYTSGNVPLSQIMKIAEARAPRGNAYESSLIAS